MRTAAGRLFQRAHLLTGNPCTGEMPVANNSASLPDGAAAQALPRHLPHHAPMPHALGSSVLQRVSSPVQGDGPGVPVLRQGGREIRHDVLEAELPEERRTLWELATRAPTIPGPRCAPGALRLVRP